MIARDTLEGLTRLLGADAVEEHAPQELDGCAPAVTLRPADGKALALAAQALSRSGLAAIVRGAGTQLAIGNPPRRGDVLLSTERLSGIDTLDADEGVCHAQSGTPVAELRERARAEGWELPLDPAHGHATLGGVLASAEIGPRCLGLGVPRDVVLGLEVALASGDRVRSGGRVVKNVSGYDLNKLYVGSFGSLGVIEGAWLRLRPLPERVQVLRATAPDADSAAALGTAAARRTTARAALLLRSAEGPEHALWVELAGDAPSVEADARWLAAEAGAVEAPADGLDAATPFLREAPPGGGLRFRLSLVASKLAPALAALAEAGAETLALPGLGLVWARFAFAGADSRAEAAAAWSRVAGLAEDGGDFRLELAPTWAKQGRDVFGAAPTAELVRAVKARFDPDGVFNPGRFAAHV